MSTTIHLRLNDKQERMLKQLAERWGYSSTNLIRKLIVDTYETKYNAGETNE